jgi:homoserine O-acetyltransferase
MSFGTDPDFPPSVGLVDESGTAHTVPVVTEGLLEIPGPWRLHHGGELAGVRIAWRLEGAAGGPVVAAMGGISAHRMVFSVDDPKAGWWSTLVGPGQPLDTRRFRVLGFDFLGGSGLTTGPAPADPGFPPVSSYDQAEVLARLCDALGVARLHAIAGASYGAMVALAFGERHPARVGHLLVISGAHRTNPLSTAWRSVQREMIRHGLALGDGQGGVRLARALAMATYRTRAEFEQRFGGEPRREAGRFVFPVEEYLFARGEDYAKRYAPAAFLCLSESIDLHRVQPARIAVPATLVAVTEDQLVPLHDMSELAAGLAGPCSFHEIHSIYGHDAFLKERDRLAPAFAEALA